MRDLKNSQNKDSQELKHPEENNNFVGNKSDFKIGDNVIVTIKLSNFIDLKGFTGKVCNIIMDGSSIGVEFNNWNRGHDCDGSAKPSSGYYVAPHALEHIKGILKIKQWKNSIT